MDLNFKINDKVPGEKPTDPQLGIIEGFIQEGINQVSLIELILVCNKELTEEECGSYIGQKATIGLGGHFKAEYLWSRFDGFIYELHMLDSFGIEAGLFKYQMTIRPGMWNMNYVVQAQSNQNITRIEAVEQALNFSFMERDKQYQLVIPGKDDPTQYPKLKQILQNKISDLAFVQNLLAEAGINYFFCAEKDGDSAEYLKLIDSRVNFLDPFVKMKIKDNEIRYIPYNPGAGLAGNNCRIDWLERHHRASVSKAFATANLGDGKVKEVFFEQSLIYDKSKEAAYSYMGMYRSHGCEGEEEKVAELATQTRGQYFTASRVTYEGRSNHFLLRPGEPFVISDKEQRTVLHEVLITTVFHHFRQTSTVATLEQKDQHPEYGNLFTGVKNIADYRPDQTFGKTVTEMRKMFTQSHSFPAVSDDDSEPISRENMMERENFELKKQIAELRRDLAVTKELSGLMVGEVIEAASVTDGNELVCKVKNELFGNGLTIKVALGWLTQQGRLYLLPRVGMQVYFQFINGEGGQNEAVMVGYRPSDGKRVPKPEETTDCTQLVAGDAPKAGEPIDKAVGSSKFKPLNKYRNSLTGQDGVAEVAVIDGEEASVYLNADNRICLISKKSVSVSTGSLCESAGSLSQQMGSVTQKVTKDKFVTVDNNFERTVTGYTTESTTKDVFMTSSEGAIGISSDSKTMDIFGSESVTLHDKEDEAKVVLAGDTITAEVKDGNKIGMSPVGITAKAGTAKMFVTTDENATLLVGENKVVVDTDSVDIRFGDSTIVVKNDSIEIKGGSSVTVKADTISVEGKSVTVNGTTEGNYNGGGATINASGGMLKLNG